MEVTSSSPLSSSFFATFLAYESFLRSVLKNEGKCWTLFYKYVKRHKGNREGIAVIKDGNGHLIIDSLEKANSSNFCYSSVFSSELSISQIQRANSFGPYVY
jgi:hypothetical protein